METTTTDKLDMSLDDLIEQHKRRGGGDRGRRRGTGGIRKTYSRGTGRRGGRGTPRPLGAGQSFTEPVLDARGKWKKETTGMGAGVRRRGSQSTGRMPSSRPRQMYRPVTIPPQRQQPPPAASYRQPPTEKLFLSNLEYRVSERDLLELFSQIGPLRGVRVNYDKSGRSLGTGEVTFEVPLHASMAERRFNGILIDSKPLVIQKSGAQSEQNTGPTKLSSGITVMATTHSY